MTTIRSIAFICPTALCLALAANAFAEENADIAPTTTAPAGVDSSAIATAPGADSDSLEPPQAAPTPPPAGFLPPAPASQPAVPYVVSTPTGVTDAASANAGEVAVPRRIGLGLRLAYSNPGGKAWGSVPQQEMTKGMLRLQADIDYPLLPNLVGGVYGAIGVGADGDGVSASCKSSGVSCDVFALDIGFQGTVLVMPSAAVDPWLGLAVGLDVMSVSVDYGSYDESISLYGPALTLSAGVDIDVGPVVLGPYLAYQLGWYTSRDVSDAYYSSSPDEELEDVSTHSWWTLGMRGSFSGW